LTVYCPSHVYIFTAGVTQYSDYSTVWTTRVPFPAGAGNWSSLFATASRPTLGPTLPLMEWVSGVLTLGVKRPGR